MLTKRIIPCLDVNKGRVVKGINFIDLIDAGDPVELAKRYNEQGADELIFLDITASVEKRKTMVELVRKVAKELFIPFSVGGGISTIEDIQELLKAGADKVTINTATVKNLGFLPKAAEKFGSQCIVVAIDAKRKGDSWEVYVNGGRKPVGIDAIEWAKIAAEMGAGELLVTSMDRDGTKEGFDLELTRTISEAVNIPVIASGGAGTLKSMKDAIVKGKADAVLAASIFHYGKYTVNDVKDYLENNNVEVRKNDNPKY